MAINGSIIIFNVKIVWDANFGKLSVFDSLSFSLLALLSFFGFFLDPSLFCSPSAGLLYSSWQLKNRNRAIDCMATFFQGHQLGVKLTNILKAQPISFTAGKAGKSISVLKYTLCFFRFFWSKFSCLPVGGSFEKEVGDQMPGVCNQMPRNS